MNFVKHFIGDYARDTVNLTLTQHGAYRQMLDLFYGMGAPLPLNRKELYRLLRAQDGAEKKAIDHVVERYWREMPEDLETVYEWLGLSKPEDRANYRQVTALWTECGLINVRALKEIVKAAVIGERNRKTAIQREANKRAATASGGAL